MASIFGIGLANAVVATLLGAGTLLLGRWLKRPAVWSEMRNFNTGASG